MKKKKVRQWKNDFLNIVSERILSFKKDNTGTFEDADDFQTAVDILGEDIISDIEAVEFDAANLLENDSFRNQLFDCLEFDYSNKISQDETEVLAGILERSGYGVLKLNSLADEIRFEEMGELFAKTPYSTNLLFASI